jgi:lysophospholipase L1-like esterase
MFSRLGDLAVARYCSTSRCLGCNGRVTHGQRSLTDPGSADPLRVRLDPFCGEPRRGQAKIVAIGSSTTAGEGSIKPYPERLPSFLQAQYPNVVIAMVNKGVGSQEAPAELQRFGTDVIAENPDLVIWQVGTNAVWQSPDQVPSPPSFDETAQAIREGLVRLREETKADAILMDLQYVPAVLTPRRSRWSR